jgi:ribulose-5-phosphate 4-epimerase/fuculose-1-phosphate aldolase
MQDIITTLVDANHILAREGVVDAFGHISVRHPERPEHFLLSCSRSPELVTTVDIMEFTHDGTPVDPRGRQPYLERFIHGAIYETRPEVQSIVHNHSYAVIPFAVSKTKLRPVFHAAGRIGKTVPVWDIAKKFGTTNMLVNDMVKGRDLAQRLAGNEVVLMRGHGCTVVGVSIADAVLASIYLQVNAQLQMDAIRLGPVSYLSDSEIEVLVTEPRDVGNTRAWEYLLARSKRG